MGEAMTYHELAAEKISEFLWGPDGPTGECPLSFAEKHGGVIVSTVYVQWHGECAPRWREIRDALRLIGATSIKISHALYDEDNEEEDGRGPCGASLTVEFVMPDATDDELSEHHLIPVAIDTRSGAMVTAAEAVKGARDG